MYIKPSNLNHTFLASGGTHTFYITADTAWNTYIDDPTHLSINIPSGDTGGNYRIVVTASPNRTGAQITPEISFEDNNGESVYTATIPPATIMFDPASLTFEGSGGTATLNVWCPTSWSAPGSGWIDMSPGGGNSGTTQITVEAAPNTGSTARSTGLTFTWDGAEEVTSYSISQSGHTGYVSPSILNFPATGGTATISVDALAGVNWSCVEQSYDFLSLSATAGTGDAQITVVCQPNTGATIRTDYVNFTFPDAYRSVMISQPGGAEPGTFTISPGGATYDMTGQTKQVTVVSSYPWTGSSSAGYVSLSPSTGAACATTVVNVTAAANTGSVSRTFTVVFTNSVGSSLTYQGTQGQEVRVLPYQGNFAASGESKTTNLSCSFAWTGVCDDNWFSASPLTGNGDDTITIISQENPSTTTRVGHINFTDSLGNAAQYTVVQAGKSTSISVRDTGHTYAASGQTLQTQVVSDFPWTGVSSAAWATVSPASGSSTANIRIACEDNDSVNPRNFTITFTNSQGNTATFSGTQVGRAAYINIDSASLIIPSGSSSHNFNISYTENVVVSSITAVASGDIANSLVFNANKTVLTANFGANPDQLSKYLTITVSGEDENGNPVSDVCYVEQRAAAAVVISVNGNSVVPYNDTTEAFSITSNMSGTFSVSSSAGWCSVTNLTQGGTSGSFSLSYNSNTGSSARTSTITVSQNGATTALTFTQEAYGGSTYMGFNPSTATVASGAGTYITSALNVNGIDSLTIRLLPETQGNMSVSNCIYNATNRTLTIKYNKSNSTTTQSYTRTLQGTGYNDQTYTATFTLQQSPKASPVVPSVGDVNKPIWETTHCVCNGTDYTDFEVYLEGNTVFSGRAFKYPGEETIKIELNDICRNFLENEFSWSAGYQTPSKWSRIFPVYVAGTLAGNYCFYKDWSYTPLYGAHSLNDPIIGEIPEGAFVPLCAGGNGTVNFTINGVNAGSAVVNYNQRRYMVAAQDGSTYGTSDKGILYKGVKGCAAPYVLYYENAFGGFDALPIQGKVEKTSKLTSYGMRNKVARPSRDFEYNRYANECVRSWELSTKYLTDVQASKMHHLIESCMVYLYDTAAGEIIPVVIDDSSCTWKTFKNQGRKFFNYTINVRESQTNIRK